MNHRVIHVDLQPGVPPMTMDERGAFAAHTENALIELDELAKMGNYDANKYEFLHIEFPDGDDLWALCKPRSYRQATKTVGWAVAVVTAPTFTHVTSLPDDEIDGALVSVLGLEGEPAEYWTKRV